MFAVPKQQVTRAKLARLARHSKRPLVGILPTGWAATGGCGGGAGVPWSGARVTAAAAAFTSKVDGGEDDAPPVHAVPYSLHAPHAELEALVAALRPAAVVGNTKPPGGDAPPIDVVEQFSHLLSRRGKERGEGAAQLNPRKEPAVAGPVSYTHLTLPTILLV